MAGEKTDPDKQMINQHPITPPLELVQQWYDDSEDPEDNPFAFVEDIANQAARWGADQELEACCEWLCAVERWKTIADHLRSSRRPNPPSLKEQALALIDGRNDPHKDHLDDDALDIIRRALEALPDSQ